MYCKHKKWKIENKIVILFLQKFFLLTLFNPSIKKPMSPNKSRRKSSPTATSKRSTLSLLASCLRSKCSCRSSCHLVAIRSMSTMSMAMALSSRLAALVASVSSSRVKQQWIEMNRMSIRSSKVEQVVVRWLLARVRRSWAGSTVRDSALCDIRSDCASLRVQSTHTADLDRDSHSSTNKKW